MSRRKKLVLSLSLVILLVAAVAGGIAWRTQRTQRLGAQPLLTQVTPPEITLTPAQADRTGTEVSSAFTLTALKPLAISQVQQSLHIQPALELHITPSGSDGKQFTITPARALEPNRVYRFTLDATGDLSRAYRWAFQTKTAFRVVGSLPRDQSSGVPLNTGIEITFSHEGYADPTPYFAITPQVAGRFERHKKTLVFVPNDKLQPGTVYTVTLKQGLGLDGGSEHLTRDVRFAFETQATDNKGSDQSYFYVPTEAQEFAAGVAPYLQVYGRQGADVAVTVYRYPDATGYIAALSKSDAIPWWATFAHSQQREESGGLAKVTSFTGRPQEFPRVSTYLLFPATLPPGYYLADLKSGDQVRQVHFQVTDLVSYAAVTSTKTLVWLHDLQTHDPIAGAQVSLADADRMGLTDKDGVATLPTPPAAGHSQQPVGVYLIARIPADAQHAAKEAVIPASVGSNYYQYAGLDTERAAHYWKYVYLDRTLFKPDDTLNAWGVLRPREPGTPPATTVTAEVIRNDYRDGDRTLPLVSATFPVQDGTFTGSLALPSLSAGWYSLQLRMGDTYLKSTAFEVATYTKPAYKLDVTADKRAVFTGEPLRYDVKAAFFEGTPVANLQLDYSVDDKHGTLTTDRSGQASFTYIPPEGTSQWGVQSQAWFSVHAKLPEAGELSATAYPLVFSRDIDLTLDARVDKQQATVTVDAYQVTLDKINGGAGYDYHGAPAAGRPVEGTVLEETWEAEEDGTYYDFIQKVFQKSYRYRSQTKVVGTVSGTLDGSGHFAYSMPVADDKSYQVKLVVKDQKGRDVPREVHFSGQQWHYQNTDSYRYYYLDTPGNSTGRWPSGAPVSLTFMESRTPVADRPRSFLLLTSRLGLQSFQVQDSGTFQFALQPGDAPNTYVGAVYFDGRMYREAPTRAIYLDPAERQLQVTVTPDRQIYRPGATVTLAVAVKDHAGRPVAAQVNLNLVDEALFALRDNEAHVLQDLYADTVPSGVLRTRRSHNVPEPGSGAEKGGEGGGARKDFQDAIFFASITTDAQGHATAQFKVPDNLTTWRVTYQALAPATMEATSGTVGIPVKLPFFVDAVLGSTYLTGDKPMLTVRSYGTALPEGQAVQLTTRVQTPDGTTPLTNTAGTALQPSVVPLPTLTTGTYKVTVSGSAAGGLQDALELPVTVVDSFLRQEKVDFYLLDNNTQVKGAEKGLTTLTFTDYPRSRYQQLLYHLRCTCGNRFEQKLARTVAADLLRQHFGATEPPQPLDVQPYQTSKGSVAILPYSDGDLRLSALAADLAAERFARTALTLYFQTVLDDPKASREEGALALYGLAALDQPVLPSVLTALQQPSPSLHEQLALAMAAAKMGDLESARPIYAKVLLQYGERIGSNARLFESGWDQDEIISATALTGALAAKLGEPQAPAFAGYLAENQPLEVLPALEEALIASSGLASLPATPISFTYTAHSQAVHKELKPGESFRLALTAADLASLQFTDVVGQVGLTARYEAPLAQADLKQQSGYLVSRSYSVGGQSTTTLHPGDLVEIKLTYSLPGSSPGGAYQVTDYLPAGLRLVQRPWEYGAKYDPAKYPAWPLEVNGQRVTFWAGKDGKPITYYARVVSPGTFTAEEPVLQHQASGLIYAHGSRLGVEIQ